jgi:uncharacterized membrane protein
MVVAYNKIKHEKKKFLITILIIIASATMVNYGIYSLLEFYFEGVDTTYKGIQMNMLFTIITIGIVTILMFAILPKESVDEMLEQISGEGDRNKSPEQILQDMIDGDNSEENNNKK